MSDKDKKRGNIGNLGDSYSLNQETILDTKKQRKTLLEKTKDNNKRVDLVVSFSGILKTSLREIFIFCLMVITVVAIIKSIFYETIISDYQTIFTGILKPIADFSGLIKSDARFIAIMVIILGIFSTKAIANIIRLSGIKNLANLVDKIKK